MRGDEHGGDSGAGAGADTDARGGGGGARRGRERRHTRLTDEQFAYLGRLLIDQTEEYAIFFLDPDARIVAINPGARRILRYEEDELVGRTADVVFTPEDIEAGVPERELEIAREKGEARDNRWHTRSDGTRFWGSGRMIALRDDAGRIVGYGKVMRDLTEEHRLREAKAYLAGIVESSEDAIIGKTLDGIITSWNPSAERMYGYTADEAIGRPISILIPPDQPNELPGIMERLRRGERIEHYETERMTKDGRRIRVALTVSPIRDADGEIIGASAVARDVTAERRAIERERYLAEVGRVLASSLDYEVTLRRVARLTVPELADWCVIDLIEADGEVKRVAHAGRDERVEALTGELVRNVVVTTRTPQPSGHVLRTGEPVLAREVDDAWLREHSIDDEHFELLKRLGVRSVISVPLASRGQVLGALTMVRAERGREYGRDDLALAEQVALRAGTAVDNARLYRDAIVANQAKSDFLAVMSHELRTPLNAILGFTDLLDAEVVGPMNERQREQLARVRANARHLLELINEVLMFSRIEAGREEVALERVDVAELTRETGALVRPLALEKGLGFTVEVSDAPVHIRTDPGKVRQILLNLLSNAIKFTDEGEITVTVTREHDGVSLRVRDTGIGISDELRDRIFDPFWQVESAAARRPGGTGLGLSVSRRLVDLLHGEVSVTSEVGKGSTFTVWLPADAARG